MMRTSRALPRRVSTGCLLLAALAPGSRLAAQDARLRQRLDSATYAGVSVLLDSARAAHLPVEPLAQKALEGQSKGADGARIVAAVRRLSAELAASRRALGPEAPESDLLAASTLLGLGIDTLALRRVHAQERGGGLAGAFMGVAFLVQRGVAPGTSLDIVDAMLVAGLTDVDFGTLQRLVAGDIRLGASPADAARTRAQGLIRQAEALRRQQGPRR